MTRRLAEAVGWALLAGCLAAPLIAILIIGTGRPA